MIFAEIPKRVVFVYDGEYSVYVSNKTTLAKLSADGGQTFKDKTCEAIDDRIAYYCSDEQFNTLSDDELTMIINIEVYDYQN